jgi:hypothetical protein
VKEPTSEMLIDAGLELKELYKLIKQIWEMKAYHWLGKQA